MTEHEGAVESHVVESWWHRAGCRGCGWRGPWRELREVAQRDAERHLADVERHPPPGSD